jgi:hypothetical protein
MASFERRPELGVSTTHIQNFWIEELSEERDRLQHDPRAAPLPGYVTMTMLARRTVFERVGLFKPKPRRQGLRQRLIVR